LNSLIKGEVGETPPLASDFRDILYNRDLLIQGGLAKTKKSTGVIFHLLLGCQDQVEGEIMGLVEEKLGV